MMDVKTYDALIERDYPALPWREPVVIRIGAEASGMACRLCIARLGFKAQTDRDRLFQTLQQFAEHMRETHEPEQHEN